MAKILDLSQTERPTPRLVSSNTPGPGPGPSDAGARGLQQASRDIAAGAEEIYRAQKIEEDRINTLRAEDAFTRVLEKKHDLTFGENGFVNLRGGDAVNKPLLPEYTKRLEAVERDISAGLANDEQRMRFKQRVNVARVQFQEDILRHTARERIEYGKQVYTGIVDTAQREATARWDSPNDIAGELVRIADAVAERADSEGWAPEFAKAELLKEQSKVHTAVVQQAIATGNYKYAEEWFKANNKKGQIDLATAKVLEVAVRDGTQKELSNHYNALYLVGEDSYRTLESLRKTVLGDGALDEARKNILVGRIQNRQFVLERRLEVAEAKRLNTVGRQLTALNDSTLAGFEPTLDQFAPVMAAARGTELETDVQQAIALANSTRAFRNAPPVVQERLLAEAEAGVRTEPTKFDRRVVGAWRSIYDNQRRQAVANPVAFAVQQGIVPPPQPLDLSNPREAGSALAERFSIARGVAARYQTPFKPLTDAETEVVSSVLAAATIEQKRNYFGQLAEAAGGDLGGYMGIMAQLAPDQPVVAIAGSAAARGRAQAADLMLRGQSILQPSKKADGKPDGGGLYPLPPETDLRMRFDGYVREAFSGKPEARNAHYQAAKAIYAALSVDAGDRDSKVLDADRWEQAITQAIGPIEKYQGRRIVMPHGYTYDLFRDGLRQRLENVVSSGRLDASWTLPRLLELPLENVGDGRYVLKAGDGVVVGLPAHNKPILKNPDGSISTERTITVEAGGKHFVLPTIVNGKQVSEDEAVRQWQSGSHQAVGSFGTAAEANAFAQKRSAALGEALRPQPIILDFNTSLPFRSSGERAGITAAREEPSAAELAAAARPVTGRAQPRPDRK